VIDKEVNTINKINFNFILGLIFIIQMGDDIDNSSVKVSPLTFAEVITVFRFCPFILSHPRKISLFLNRSANPRCHRYPNERFLKP
jgi:hypothetical protein